MFSTDVLSYASRHRWDHQPVAAGTTVVRRHNTARELPPPPKLRLAGARTPATALQLGTTQPRQVPALNRRRTEHPDLEPTR